ncbi:MAG: hypothetical protein GY775_14605, partial [Candidatus Scalindua sp.]|nr:hypothetical protein [Candidatus Scalindua sp.]
MQDKIHLTALFNKGTLIQIGDEINIKGEFLDTINTQRFQQYHKKAVVKNITSKSEILCNSCYLNQGLSFETNGGLGYKIITTEGETEYGYESTLYLANPDNSKEWKKYLNRYFSNTLNSQKLEYLLWFIKKDQNIKPSKKNLNCFGTWLYMNQRRLFDYMVVTFKIRGGYYEPITCNNMSDITFKWIKKIFGERNNSCIIERLINSTNTFTNGKLFISGKSYYYSNIKTM